jgi:hypothetical protein
MAISFFDEIKPDSVIDEKFDICYEFNENQYGGVALI